MIDNGRQPRILRLVLMKGGFGGGQIGYNLQHGILSTVSKRIFRGQTSMAKPTVSQWAKLRCDVCKIAASIGLAQYVAVLATPSTARLSTSTGGFAFGGVDSELNHASRRTLAR